MYFQKKYRKYKQRYLNLSRDLSGGDTPSTEPASLSLISDRYRDVGHYRGLSGKAAILPKHKRAELDYRLSARNYDCCIRHALTNQVDPLMPLIIQGLCQLKSKPENSETTETTATTATIQNTVSFVIFSVEASEIDYSKKKTAIAIEQILTENNKIDDPSFIPLVKKCEGWKRVQSDSEEFLTDNQCKELTKDFPDSAAITQEQLTRRSRRISYYHQLNRLKRCSQVRTQLSNKTDNRDMKRDEYFDCFVRGRKEKGRIFGLKSMRIGSSKEKTFAEKEEIRNLGILENNLFLMSKTLRLGTEIHTFYKYWPEFLRLKKREEINNDEWKGFTTAFRWTIFHFYKKSEELLSKLIGLGKLVNESRMKIRNFCIITEQCIQNPNRHGQINEGSCNFGFGESDPKEEMFKADISSSRKYKWYRPSPRKVVGSLVIATILFFTGGLAAIPVAAVASAAVTGPITAATTVSTGIAGLFSSLNAFFLGLGMTSIGAGAATGVTSAASAGIVAVPAMKVRRYFNKRGQDKQKIKQEHKQHEQHIFDNMYGHETGNPNRTA